MCIRDRRRAPWPWAGRSTRSSTRPPRATTTATSETPRSGGSSPWLTNARTFDEAINLLSVATKH
eukprot:11504015-Alexandrium_andersonii.AAC.1